MVNTEVHIMSKTKIKSLTKVNFIAQQKFNDHQSF